MPRDLQISDDNSITLFDPLEKFEVVFTHRTPNTDDRVRYLASRYKREGDRMIDRSRSALIEAALSVLTGIRPGDFTFGGAGISSTPGADGYRQDWKALVNNAAGDLLFLMGHELFEGHLAIPEGMRMEVVSEFEAGQPEPSPEEPLPPLAKCSAVSGSPAPRSAKRSAKGRAARTSK